MKVEITFKSWDYHCSDGCCSEYGTSILLNGKEVEHHDNEQHDNRFLGDDAESALKSVLKALGYEVEFSYE